MASLRGQERLIRQWKLVDELSRHRRGLTAQQMIERLELSKATLHRYLGQLIAAGIPIGKTPINGEVRYTLESPALPPLGPSALQLAALRLARRGLAGLAGAQAVAQLDALLHGYALNAEPEPTVSIALARVVAPDLTQKLDKAIYGKRRTRIRYRSVGASKPEWRVVDPIVLRKVQDELYFVAHDEKRASYVSFKLDRISGVEVLADKAARHDRFDVEAFFAHSRKAWTGSPSALVNVVVRLSANVARYAHEYRLIDSQTLEDEPSGAVIVRARVAGVLEAMRWVLGWGKEAEALEPAELREAVAEQTRGAAAHYEPIADTARPRRARQAGRLTDREPQSPQSPSSTQRGRGVVPPAGRQ